MREEWVNALLHYGAEGRKQNEWVDVVMHYGPEEKQQRRYLNVIVRDFLIYGLLNPSRGALCLPFHLARPRPTTFPAVDGAEEQGRKSPDDARQAKEETDVMSRFPSCFLPVDIFLWLLSPVFGAFVFRLVFFFVFCVHI